MSKTEEKTKRKYTKTPRWTVATPKATTDTTGLVEALKTANSILRGGEAEEVTIKRIKKG